MPSRSYTIETRIPGNTELAGYLDAYVAEYNAVAREMWHDMTLDILEHALDLYRIL